MRKAEAHEQVLESRIVSHALELRTDFEPNQPIIAFFVKLFEQLKYALLRSEPKVVEVEPTHPSTDLLSQLRSINSSIEQVGHQLDDTIDQLRGDRGPVHARRWESDEDYSRSSETPESDGSDWVVVITLILAGLAGLILVAALLGSPLVP